MTGKITVGRLYHFINTYDILAGEKGIDRRVMFKIKKNLSVIPLIPGIFEYKSTSFALQ